MNAIVAWLAGLLRIVWVCRVGVVNSAVGLLFFGLLVQAQNLMADLSSWGSGAELVFWAGVFGFAFLLWAFPVHYGARRSIDQLARLSPAIAAQHPWLVALLPRLLGLLPFGALALGIRGAREQAAGAAELLPATAGATMTQGLWLYGADAIAAVLFVGFVCVRRRLLPAAWDGRILYPLAVLATATIFAAAYVAPLATSVYFPRALLVPPLFGSLVLGASWLTRLGDRTGFPFLATVALLLGLSTGLNAHFDDLRTLPGLKDERLDVDAALARWKAANGCGPQAESQGTSTAAPCPHPIVVAIDGGASRAAFTAATFVGELLDKMPKPGTGDAATPGRRIFAISGVSGGSYGAAVIQAALLDAQRGGDGLTPPCRSAQTTWFGFEDWHERGNAFTWRQCLQALTSGDYLSSTIIGLAFRDLAAPPWQKLNLPAMEDRAAILEMTWERQYAATMEPGRSFYEGGDRCRDGDESGLCRRMAHPAAQLGEGRWMPLLLLNGTSVASGRRIVSSDLMSVKIMSTGAGTRQASGGALYSQAFDLREAMSEPCAQPSDGAPPGNVCTTTPPPVDGPDVRLSTAALTSARFPIISPAGVFHMKSSGDKGSGENVSGFGDQVVDGGYFENSGLTTALDIVHALAERQVQATVVSISNNPAYAVQDSEKCRERFGQAKLEKATRFFPSRCTGLPPRPATTPLVGPADDGFVSRFFALFTRPFQTLVASGDGHADELMALIQANPPGGGFYHLQVAVTPDFAPPPSTAGTPPESPPAPDAECDALRGKTMAMAKVSMSWWLAAAAQADLDIQRCSWSNRVVLDKLVERLQRESSHP